VKATIGGKTFWQLREITSGDGIGSAALIAHLGLGDATNVDTVRIEWPSGTVQTITNLAARQFLTLTEPPTLNAPSKLPDGSFQLSLIGGIGLMYDIETSGDLAMWNAWASLTCTNRTMMLTDTNSTESTKRFYRAVMR